MKKILFISLAMLVSGCFYSCTEDEPETIPSEKPDDGPEENPGDNNDNKEEEDSGYSSDRHDEGVIAFNSGTNMDVDAMSDETIDYVWFKAPQNIESKVVYKAKGEEWIQVSVYESEGDKHYAYINISSNNTNAAREADVVFAVGAYKKAIHVRQRAKGDELGEQKAAYFDTNFWERTDREKMGFFGPVKYFRDCSFSSSSHKNYEYYFDEAGHLTKLVQQEEYVYEYKYNAKGQRTYCKCYDMGSGAPLYEEFWEYDNPGRLVYLFPEASDDAFVPELSKYRKTCNPEYSTQIIENTYTFTDDNKLRVEEKRIDGNYNSVDTYIFDLADGKLYNYADFNSYGEGHGISGVAFFKNGMLASLIHTFGSAYGYEYREDMSFRFADYDGRMLIEHYENVQPEYPNSQRNIYHDYFYNAHKDLRQVDIKTDQGVIHCNYTGYIYDSHGNWTHRVLSDTSWGTQQSWTWFVDCSDRLIDYFE